MAPTRRIFLGIFPPIETARAVHLAVRAPLAAAGVRLVPPEEIHLTLHFFGATDASAIPGLRGRLAASLTGMAAPDFVIRGTGAFPSVSRARVLWVGLAERRGAEGRSEALARAGSAAVREERWMPHLTVARAREGGRVPDAFRDLWIEIPWAPEEVRLVESHPGADGPGRFPTIATFGLSRDSA